MNVIETPDMVPMGIRLGRAQRAKLRAIAAANYNKPAALIRMAVDQLIAAAKANGGKLPTCSSSEHSTDNRREVAVAHAGGAR